MKIFTQILDRIQEAIFPIFCFGCGLEGEWICQSCFGTIDTRGTYACPVCHGGTLYGLRCARCRDQGALDRVVAVTRYDDSKCIGTIIHAYKYQYAAGCAPLLGTLVGNFFLYHRSAVDHGLAVDMIVPVPLHGRRFAERGYNQAATLAAFVGAALAVPVVQVLERHRYTEVQARLKKAGRKENVSGAFRICERGLVAGRRVLLVDDVYTTGSTMQECARTLLAAGAAAVSGFVLARG